MSYCHSTTLDVAAPAQEPKRVTSTVAVKTATLSVPLRLRLIMLSTLRKLLARAAIKLDILGGYARSKYYFYGICKTAVAQLQESP